MEKTEAVKAAVDADEAIVACAYVGYEHEELKSALPDGFKARQYVAKFVNGELVAIEPGRPEAAILKLLGKSADALKPECKSCDDKTCDDCPKPEIPSH